MAGTVSTGRGGEIGVVVIKELETIWGGKTRGDNTKGVFGGFDVSRRRLCLVVLMGLRGGG